MAVQYAALSACRKVHPWRYSGRKDVTDGNDNGTDGQTDRQTDRQSATRRNMRPPPREDRRIKTFLSDSVIL